MIAVFASIGIIIIFVSEAKKHNKNKIKWAFLGLVSFWVTSILPIYFLIEHVIGHRNDTIGILLILGIIFTFFCFGAFTCYKVYKHIKVTS